MGPHKQSGKAVITLYIMDDLGILIVVYTLNYVKIKDLSEDKRVQGWFTFVLFSFWLQFVSYWIISGIQIAFGLVAPTIPISAKAYSVLTLWGQLVYLSKIRDCVWRQLHNKEKPAIGAK